MLSEESSELPYAVRSQWSRYWLVDPLDGTREFIKVLRLLEHHAIPELKHAVEYALEIGAVGADAIRLILEYQQESPIALFSLEGRPHLKLVQVAKTDVSVYQSLLIGG